MKNSLSKLLSENTNSSIIWILMKSKKKYSEMLKELDEKDSGKFNYHLKKLIYEGIVEKDGELYTITKKGIKYASYTNFLQLKEKYPLPVVLVSINKDNKILLGKRSRESFNNYWGLLGNKILYGEDPIETAKREVETELGFNFLEGKISAVYPTIYRIILVINFSFNNN